MKIRPILFSGSMVRALLDGRKTQTRRISKFFDVDEAMQFDPRFENGWWKAAHEGYECQCPYGLPGDRLRVKEAAWMWCEKRPNGRTKLGRPKWRYVPMREATVFYASDHPAKPAISVFSPETGNAWDWRLKIGRFLPRWASRITLEIESVQVERLQEIKGCDAIAEGIEAFSRYDVTTFRDYLTGATNRAAWQSYQTLWESINGPKSWEENCFVWVVGFRVLPATGKEAA